MTSLRAHVHNGRLLLDEPTNLPEGEIVELIPVDEVLGRGGDYLDDAEREGLHDAIERGIEQGQSGRAVDATELITKLRARAASR